MPKQIAATFGAGNNWSKAATKASVTPATNGTTATLGAEAIAVGDDTVANGNVSLSIVDRGAVTMVRGQATATAQASGGTTYASADTYASVAGADFVLIRTVNSGSGTSSASSTTKVTAFNFEKFDLPGGPIELNLGHNMPAPPTYGSISGNVATIHSNATATGGGSVTITQTDSLTTDDLSVIHGDAWGFIA